MKRLYDPTQHPDWIPPHSAEWHANLESESGVYQYPWQSVFDEPRAEVIFADRISHFLHENAKVLDVGCGHGAFMKAIAHNAKEVVGIDVVEGYVATAREGAGGAVNFLVVDADKPLPFPDDSYDVIYTKKGPWLFHEGAREGHRIRTITSSSLRQSMNANCP